MDASAMAFRPDVQVWNVWLLMALRCCWFLDARRENDTPARV